MAEWSLRIDAARAGRRVDRQLRRARPDLPYARIQRLFREQQIVVNGRPVPADHRLGIGDEVRILAEARVETVPASALVPLRIVHEDAHLIAVSKPAGLAVHPGKKQHTRTLLSGLLDRYGPELRRLGDARSHGLVHRLDLETSGILLVARTAEAHDRLLAQFRTRRVGKSYRALVSGGPPRASGTIRLPLERVVRAGRTRVRVNLRGAGHPATTDYAVLCTGPRTAYLAVEPKTGRTHQIRVHLASLGTPVCGDAIYGNAPANAWAARELGLVRMFLHAAQLTVQHPGSGATVTFTSSLPPSLRAVLERLGVPDDLAAPGDAAAPRA